jgi:hypothetical protein
MNESIVNAKNWSQTSRQALAPVLRMQQDGLRVWDRAARCEYAIAGDYLEWALAQCQVTLGAGGPTDLLARQAELSIKFNEQLQRRIQEFANTVEAGPATATLPPHTDPTAAVVNATAAVAELPMVSPVVEIAAPIVKGLATVMQRPIPAAPGNHVAAAAVKPTASVSAVFPANAQSSPTPSNVAGGRSQNERMNTAKRRSPAAGRSTSTSSRPKSRK